MAYRYGPPWRDIKAEADLETMEKHCFQVSYSGLLSGPSYTAPAHLTGMLQVTGAGSWLPFLYSPGPLPGMLWPMVGWILAHKPARKKARHSQAPGQSMKADEPQQRLPPPGRVRVTSGASQQQWTFCLTSGPQLDLFRNAHICGIQCGQRPRNGKENYGKEGERLSITVWGA